MPATETTQKDPVIVVLQLTGGNEPHGFVDAGLFAGMDGAKSQQQEKRERPHGNCRPSRAASRPAIAVI